MIEQLTGKYEFKYYLPPDTEEKVIITGACLIGNDNEIIVKCSPIQNPQGEVINFLNVIEWLRIDRDLYHVYGDAIHFTNGSKIVFINQ